jgi:adenylosuccinate synthase
MQSVDFFANHIFNANDISEDFYFDTVIFEGNQGILLDKYHGFYPNVTYGYTTNRKVKYDRLNTFYVSRCYATKHGYGTLKNENLEIPELINTEFEQNHLNPYQDNFRVAMLDYEMVEYAIKCDQSYNKNLTSNLVFTCLDQYENPKMTFKGDIVDFEVGKFSHLVDHIFTNDSPESKTVKLWK